MINGIVAVDSNQGIGFNGQMPWPHLKGDMSFFKNVTTNNIVIMGSTTWKSLNCKPLPNRINIVLSRTHDYSGNNGADHTFSDPSSALNFCQLEYIDKEIFIIGGSEIYNIYLNEIDKFYITEINEHYNCNKFFNSNYIKNNFKNVKELLKYSTPVNYTIKEYTK
jgi:dihydrofolate reductase